MKGENKSVWDRENEEGEEEGGSSVDEFFNLDHIIKLREE